MAQEATIVADLQKIEDGGKKDNVQIWPGYAYLSSSILLQHGENYQYPIDNFISQIQLQENVYQEADF